MKRLFILFLILPFIFTSCKKNEIKTKQNQTTEKTSELKKIELLELPRDFNEWSKEPISIDKNKDSEIITIDNIIYVKSWRFNDYYSYETSTLEQKFEPIETPISISVSISSDSFSIYISPFKNPLLNSYIVDMKEPKNIEKFSKLFLESGLFSVIDELKNYEMYYEKLKTVHHYKDFENN